MINAVIFTYPPDYLSASYAAESLRRAGASVTLAIDEKDPEPPIEDCRIVRTDFPRGGNLNGMATVRGQLQVIHDAAKFHGDPEYSLKVDSDSMVFGFRWLQGRTETVVGLRSREEVHRRSLYGFCYAIRSEALPAMIEEAGRMPFNRWCPEDITTGIIASKVGKLFTYKNRDAGTRLGAFGWDDKGSVEDWMLQFDALCFQRNIQVRSGRLINRRDVSNKMKEFLLSEHRLHPLRTS